MIYIDLYQLNEINEIKKKLHYLKRREIFLVVGGIEGAVNEKDLENLLLFCQEKLLFKEKLEEDFCIIWSTKKEILFPILYFYLEQCKEKTVMKKLIKKTLIEKNEFLLFSFKKALLNKNYEIIDILFVEIENYHFEMVNEKKFYEAQSIYYKIKTFFLEELDINEFFILFICLFQVAINSYEKDKNFSITSLMFEIISKNESFSEDEISLVISRILKFFDRYTSYFDINGTLISKKNIYQKIDDVTSIEIIKGKDLKKGIIKKNLKDIKNKISNKKSEKVKLMLYMLSDYEDVSYDYVIKIKSKKFEKYIKEINEIFCKVTKNTKEEYGHPSFLAYYNKQVEVQKNILESESMKILSENFYEEFEKILSLEELNICEERIIEEKNAAYENSCYILENIFYSLNKKLHFDNSNKLLENIINLVNFLKEENAGLILLLLSRCEINKKNALNELYYSKNLKNKKIYIYFASNKEDITIEDCKHILEKLDEFFKYFEIYSKYFYYDDEDLLGNVKVKKFFTGRKITPSEIFKNDFFNNKLKNIYNILEKNNIEIEEKYEYIIKILNVD